MIMQVAVKQVTAELMEPVLDAGGDYFFQLKNKNRFAHKAAVQ